MLTLPPGESLSMDEDAHSIHVLPAFPTLLGAGTAAKASAATDDLTVPASTVEGDLLLLAAFAEGSGLSDFTTTGFTDIYEDDVLGVAALMVGWKAASAADEAGAGSDTYTVSIDGSPTAIGGVLLAISRADIADPVVETSGNAGNALEVAAPSLTPDGYNRLIVAIGASRADTTVSWPAGFTEVAETSAGGASITVSAAVAVQEKPSDTGPTTCTQGTSTLLVVQHLLVRPA